MYEGKELENAKSQRYKLIGKHYFGGVYEGRKGNETLWMKVWKYIDNHYDTDYLKDIYKWRWSRLDQGRMCHDSKEPFCVG